jgi:hypothetical protein
VEDKIMSSYDSADFPAAHSMDTIWFAVDSDGHVAVFETGEPGEVPTTAYVGEDPEALIDRVAAQLPKADPILDLDGWRAANYGLHVALEHANAASKIIMFVRSLDDAGEWVELLEARVLRASEGVALRFAYPDRATFATLHDLGMCVACFYDWPEIAPRVCDHGIYAYDYAGMEGPYARCMLPVAPVRLPDLPIEIAAVAIRFDGRFAETPVLQPAELWACETWVPSWFAPDKVVTSDKPPAPLASPELRDQLPKKAP